MDRIRSADPRRLVHSLTLCLTTTDQTHTLCRTLSQPNDTTTNTLPITVPPPAPPPFNDHRPSLFIADLFFVTLQGYGFPGASQTSSRQ
ncbi:hypothetical protein PIB30_064259 [Stylosanthes scabra]|uniref:Uncharacterized protein n=1 Tax=Stylosanthes scabra TaxID=79078 RepID=A0ABU6XLG9_9FABA|nr:hypothetical protein [Stylosanthes scabra]